METFLPKEKKKIILAEDCGIDGGQWKLQFDLRAPSSWGIPCHVTSLHTYNSLSFGKSNEQHGVKVHSVFWVISRDPDSEGLDSWAFASFSLGQTLQVIPKL